MKKVILMMVGLLVYAGVAGAENKIDPVFERIDDLLTRVESGVSLNSYAETLAQIKSEYKKAQTAEGTVYNPLLTDRMKEVMRHLDNYAQVWRFQEVDKFAYVAIGPKLSEYSQAKSCPSSKFGYSIPCIKKVITDELSDIIGKAKSAHTNGW